ncbi:DUF4422 domain-containing protein [Alphaproteobacteria bacterium KMM 3653]|uniref:DUF4422 domain-containing protein n=1 Tax=Harenicola maris TaxID=2841044 RepID=A0AAP2CU79_9RHOB|nr:DUF4422 domain-containing protein [Harenicola maris]
MKPTIYTAYHKASPLLSSRSVVPVHVGRANAAAPLPHMQGDDTGTHISPRNRAYCELTALYWAWKNDKASTHIGLMHYRRALDFTGAFEAETAEVYAGGFDIPQYLAATEDWLAAQDTIDLVVPKVHNMHRSVKNNYGRAHHLGDFDRVREIIAASHPDQLDAFDATAEGHDIRLGNMFLMRRDLCDDYCEWLFDILGQLEETDLDRSYYSSEQSRYLGFVAERLFTAYVQWLRGVHAGLKVQEVNIVNMAQAAVTPYLADRSLNGPEHVNIAFSADRAYLPHTAAMLRSLLLRSSAERQYNLFFLYSGIGEAGLEMLQEVLAPFPQAQLHPINVGNRFAGSYRSASRAPSNATYNRFLLFDLLPSLKRLLYIDVDMIVLGDVAEIFDTEMGKAKIAAVPDYIMTRTLTGKVPTVDPKVPDLYAYHKNELGLSDAQINNYFNAGLLLFNFAEMDVPKVGRDLLAMAERGEFLFRDQDILNRYFKDDLLRLPGKYNVFNTRLAGYSKVPQANHKEAMEARKAPFIIHYAAGDYKPWKGAAVPMAEHYWEHIAQTPFYAEVLREQGPKGIRRTLRPAALVRENGRKLAERFPALRPYLMGVYRSAARLKGR